MRINIIGIGGVATWLLRPLLKFIEVTYAKVGELSDVEIVLIDGDTFTETNADRQIFERCENKALVVAKQCTEQFPSIFIRPVPEYVTRENIASLITKGDIVLMCVDNYSTRKLISDHAEDLTDIVIISGGNNFTDGNVQCFVREKGENKTLSIANEYHPEIQFPRDKNPGEIGCRERAESAPQLIAMNMRIASDMLVEFWNYSKGNGCHDEVFSDIIIGSTRSVRRSP